MRFGTITSDAELAERRTKWQLPPKGKEAGCLGKYASMATSASTGAILKGRGGVIDHNVRYYLRFHRNKRDLRCGKIIRYSAS